MCIRDSPNPAPINPRLHTRHAGYTSAGILGKAAHNLSAALSATY